jgi:CRP/FNR family transcriptional regulator, cyclic AMP receptor protein
MMIKSDESHTSSFGHNSTFGASGFGNSGFGPSGIVPSTAPGMPPTLVGLLQSLHSASNADTLKLTLNATQWQVLAGYLQPFTMQKDQVLMEQGAKDVTVYLVEMGLLTVHLIDEAGKVKLATVGAGSCVGEGAFFSRMPRSASVHASTACKLWSITPMRFTELSHRHPAIALALVMALGSVLARRLVNRPKRSAVT